MMHALNTMAKSLWLVIAVVSISLNVQAQVAHEVVRLIAQIQETVTGVPTFQVDLFWPRQEGHFGEEGDWLFGSIGGIAVDPTNDHIWVATRPATLGDDEDDALNNPTFMDCCVAAPPILEFDQEGHFIQGWGGPETGYDWLKRGAGIFQLDAKGNSPILGRPRPAPGFDWWAGEQRISVDSQGNIWLAGSNQVLKFTKSGQLLLQIGHPGKHGGSNDTDNLDQPSKALVYPKTNEVFVADNRRVIVFDADTGKFKRMWGAYGNKPDDAAPLPRLFEGPAPQQFNAVQAVAISNDGLLYVADSENNRIQVFKPDGTFVREGFVARARRVPSGTAVDLAFSVDKAQEFLYIAGADDHIRILNRDTLQILGTVGRLGHYPGQFYNLHALAVDSKGNIYAGENHGGSGGGRRVQRLLFEGIASPSGPPLGGQPTMFVPSAQTQKADGVPTFQVDPLWPKMDGNFGVEGDWLFGAIGGIGVDPTNDHIWVATRPGYLHADENYALKNPTMADCCVPPPPILEFDPEGNFIRGWGGWGPDGWVGEHGINVDYRGNVWLTGANQVRKYTKTGRLLLKIGDPDAIPDSNDTKNVGVPTGSCVYPKTNEVFVADGYVNRRVIVFDADTGKFKRLWGAYGNKPDDAASWTRAFDGPPPQQFFVVHDIAISNDDLVYVSDRENNRIQVFKPDGTFVKEAFVERGVRAPSGTVEGLAFSADDGQQFLYVIGSDNHIRILNRGTLQVIGRFGRLGFYPGQLNHVHGIATDSKGNIYTADAAGDGRRIQKFVLQGISSTSTK